MRIAPRRLACNGCQLRLGWSPEHDLRKRYQIMLMRTSERQYQKVVSMPGFCSARFWLSCIFNNMARFVFRFVSGLFFSHPRVFNNFSALLSGLFPAIYVAFAFVFNHFSALFLKITSDQPQSVEIVGAR